jgi:peptide/nickel transport system permease protein
VLALLGTLIAHGIGITTGLLAAYSRGAFEAVFNRLSEMLLALPGLIFLLVLIAGFGTSLKVMVIGVGLAGAPRVARLARGAALEVRHLSFVEVAEARGEGRLHVVSREILPNILAPLGVDFGIRLASSVVVVAGISFLGLGLQPPAADWGLIISENRSGLTLDPWAMIGPLVAIGFLTVGINLTLDGARRGKRRFGRDAVLDAEAVAT